MRKQHVGITHGSHLDKLVDATLFRVFKKNKQGIVNIPLARFVGNRINILFYDAAGVYYLRKHMVKFIETAHGTKANLLSQAICCDIKNPIYVSGCRAFGLIDKVITGPTWRKLREYSSSILKMGKVYCMLKESWMVGVPMLKM